MRIAIITQDDSFYIGRFFKVFLAERPASLDIRVALVCRTMGKSPRKLLRQLHGFYGTFDFSRMLARHAGHKALALTLGKLSSRHAYSLSQIFAQHGVDVVACQNVNGKKTVGMLKEMELDLLVSVAAPQVFKKKLLQAPKLACVNIHTARLPQYRGMMPNFWAMYHGERVSAITVHTMDADIDRGDMLLQREFDLHEGESLDDLIKRTKVLGARCLLEALAEIEQHGIRAIPPPELEPSYFSFPSKAHVREFRRAGKKLL
jgi:methionyl-tRNA formyltransferase